MKTRKTIAIYAAPMSAALIVRAILFLYWLDSPFRSYHTLVGLDMRKFLLWGSELAEGRCRFTAYRGFVALVSFLFGPANLADGVVLAQLALGTIATGLTVFIFRRLFRNGIFAAAAGFLFAFHAPSLLYETHVLKATLYMFLATLALASAILAISKRGGAGWFVVCGMTAITPFLTRFSGILWFAALFTWIFFVLRERKVTLTPLFAYLGGAALVLAAVFAFELARGRSPRPFFTPNAAYVLKVGAKPVITNLSVADSPKPDDSLEGGAWSMAARYISKFRYILTWAEMPNNVNYYFERSKLSPLNLASPPGVATTLGFAGLLLMIGTPAFRRRSAPLLHLLFSFGVPMLLFVPLARYKLVLAPMLCVSAAFALLLFFRGIRARSWSGVGAVLGAVFAAFTLSAIFAPPSIVRDCDYKAYSVVVLKKPIALMVKGDFKEARAILAPLVKANPRNPYLKVEYASSLMGSGEVKLARFVLQGMSVPENRALAARWRFELGEAARMSGNVAEASDHYARALSLGLAGPRLKAARRWLGKFTKTP